MRDHLETLLQQARDASPTGAGLPRFVEGELRRTLDCGLLSRGFARLRRASCGDERLVAFSCKGRMCPSCWSRRASDTAADLVETVLAVLSGKASVDQVARRYGVLPATVAGWRDQALGGIESVLARGDSRSPRERELEHEVVQLRDLIASLSVEKALAVKAIEEWKRQSHPSQPARSRR